MKNSVCKIRNFKKVWNNDFWFHGYFTLSLWSRGYIKGISWCINTDDNMLFHKSEGQLNPENDSVLYDICYLELEILKDFCESLGYKLKTEYLILEKDKHDYAECELPENYESDNNKTYIVESTDYFLHEIFERYFKIKYVKKLKKS